MHCAVHGHCVDGVIRSLGRRRRLAVSAKPNRQPKLPSFPDVSRSPPAPRCQLLVVRDHHEGRAALARQAQHQRRTRRRPCRGRGCRWARRPARRRDAPPAPARSPPAGARRRSSAGRWLRRSPRPTGRQHVGGLAVRHLDRLAPDAQRHGDVVQRAELRQQVVELVDEAQVLVAQLPLLRGVERDICCPISCTAPAVGASRPPSRCSSVLLPEPEAPTMASVSPACTCRSTPRSTSTSSPPSVKRLVRPWQASTTPVCGSARHS